MIPGLFDRFGIGGTATRFPNVRLRTHRNVPVRFYDDLLRQKVVVLSFMYTRCEGRCPLTVATLRQLQETLGPRAGRDVFLYSITLDPRYDTPRVLGDYAAVIGAGPGWRFITGAADDIERVRRALGFVDPDPRVDADKSQHSGLLLLGSDRADRWVACPALAKMDRITKLLSRVAG
jgi:protein SCO1/2